MIEPRPWSIWTAHLGGCRCECSHPAARRCFGDLSAGVSCSQILKSFTPKHHRGWRKPQTKTLPFHRVSKQLVLKRSYKITELLCGTTCGDLPGKRCPCPTSEIIKIPNLLMLCWERAKEKINLFNSAFWTLPSPFLSRGTSFDTPALRRVALFPYLLLGSCIYIWFSVFLVIRMFLFLSISEALFRAWVCLLPANFSLPSLCSQQQLQRC